MASLRAFLSVCSFLLFIVSYPELQGPLAIVLFFVIVGFVHYLLWGRALSRAVHAESVQSLNHTDDAFPHHGEQPADYADYTEPAL